MSATTRHISSLSAPTTGSPLTLAAPVSTAPALCRLRVAALLSGRTGATVEAKPGPAATGAGVLTLSRLTLRPLEEGDRNEFIRVISASRRHLDRFCPLSKEGSPGQSAADIFNRHLELCRAGDQTGRAWRRIAIDEHGRLCGAFNLNDITRGLENTAELVFWLAADCTGRGLATEAVRGILAHAFEDLPHGLGLHKITALVSPDNTPCRRVIDACRFEPTIGGQPSTLIVSGRPIAHDEFVVYATVPPRLPEQRTGPTPLVRGLQSLLRAEELKAKSLA